MPYLILVAGPNGSGKTTLVRSGALSSLFDIPEHSINADDVARDLADGGQPTQEQSLTAAIHCDALLDQAIAAGESVMVETVLSSDKFKQRVAVALAGGYEFVLIYVTLQLGELNAARVVQRHALGGHDVPADRILARRARSHENCSWFAQQAHVVRIYDNTGARPILAAAKDAKVWRALALEALPDDLARTVRELMA